MLKMAWCSSRPINLDTCCIYSYSGGVTLLESTGDSVAFSGKQSPESNEKRRRAMRGRTLSAEHRKNLSRAALNRSPDTIAKAAAARRGHRHTPETKEKMRAAWARRKEHADHR